MGICTGVQEHIECVSAGEFGGEVKGRALSAAGFVDVGAEGEESADDGGAVPFCGDVETCVAVGLGGVDVGEAR